MPNCARLQVFASAIVRFGGPAPAPEYYSRLLGARLNTVFMYHWPKLQHGCKGNTYNKHVEHTPGELWGGGGWWQRRPNTPQEPCFTGPWLWLRAMHVMSQWPTLFGTPCAQHIARKTHNTEELWGTGPTLQRSVHAHTTNPQK